MNIGFDLDGVIAARPLVFKLNHVKGEYRINLPTWEQWFWRLVMYLRRPSYLFLPAVTELKENGNKLYLISGRLPFLEDVTLWWLAQHKLKELFDEVTLNAENEQPHVFKARTIREKKISDYYEDELFAANFIKEETNAKVFLVVANGEEVQPV